MENINWQLPEGNEKERRIIAKAKLNDVKSGSDKKNSRVIGCRTRWGLGTAQSKKRFIAGERKSAFFSFSVFSIK